MLAYPDPIRASRCVWVWIAVVMLLCPAYACATDATWSGAGDGVSWTDPLNWVPTGYPNGDYNVWIGDPTYGPGDVQLGADVSVVDLAIDPDSSLTVLAGGAYLNMTGSTINNQGQIICLGDSPNFPGTIIIRDTTTLSGGGEVQLHGSYSLLNGMIVAGAPVTLTNVDNLIHGYGNIGRVFQYELHLVNHHLVQADEADPLAIYSSWENLSVMQALAGSTLHIGGDGDNSLGLIRAEDGGAILLSAIIRGGTVRTEGSSVVTAGDYGQGGYTDVIHDAHTVIGEGIRLVIAGDIENRGTFELIGGNPALNYLQLGGDTVLTGGGVIEMNESDRNRVTGQGMSYSYLLSNVDNTIRGAGTIGGKFENRHLVEAIYATPLIVSTSSDHGINRGTMVARSGGVLRLDHCGDLDNAGGQVLAETGGRVELKNSEVVGGTVTVQSGAELRMDYGWTSMGLVENLPGGLIHAWDNNSGLGGEVVNHENATIQVDSGALLSLPGQFTELMVNAGLIRVQGGSSQATLSMTGTILGGGGEVLLVSATKEAIISGSSGSFTNLDNLIHGEGQICRDFIGMINLGTIRADNDVLTVDPHVSFNVQNRNLMEADGGILRLYDGDFDNTGGLIRAANGSAVHLEQVNLTGGVLSSADVGGVYIRKWANLCDIRNEGLLKIMVDGEATISGTIDNVNTFEVAGSSSKFVELNVDEEATLTGGGTVQMGSYLTSRIRGVNPYARLINQDNTIIGAGDLGLTDIEVVNHGRIIADSSSRLLVAPNNYGVTNTGLMAAADGGYLRMFGNYHNTGGVIEAQDGGHVELYNAIVTGGELISEGSGYIAVWQDEITLRDLAADASIRVPNQLALRLQGGIENRGTIALQGVEFETTLHINGEVTLTGGGVIELSDSTVNRIIGNSTSARLINEDNTIRGSGHLGSAAMQLVNRGVIEASGFNWLKIDLTGGDGMVNEGVMRAIGERGLILADGRFSNAGTVEVRPGSRIECVGAYEQTTGITEVDDGELIAGPGRRVEVLGGIMRGEGTITGTLRVQSDGTLSPGLNTDPLGALHVVGDVVLAGYFDVDLAGDLLGQYDYLNVDGVATVGGMIRIGLLNGYVPQVGEYYDLLVSDGILMDWPTLSYDPLPVGEFTSYALELPDGSWVYRVDVVPTPATAWMMIGFSVVAMCRRRN